MQCKVLGQQCGKEERQCRAAAGLLQEHLSTDTPQVCDKTDFTKQYLSATENISLNNRLGNRPYMTAAWSPNMNHHQLLTNKLNTAEGCMNTCAAHKIVCCDKTSESCALFWVLRFREDWTDWRILSKKGKMPGKQDLRHVPYGEETAWNR